MSSGETFYNTQSMKIPFVSTSRLVVLDAAQVKVYEVFSYLHNTELL